MQERISWVPTITGNLSFSTIGFGRSPRKAFKDYRAFASARIVHVAQRRRKSDTVLSPIIDPIRGRRGTHVFLLFGENASDNAYNALSGSVFIVSPKFYVNVATPFLRELVSSVEESTYRNWSIRLRERLIRELDSRSGAVVGVCLYTLSRQGRLLLRLDDLRFTQSEIDVLASQSYFFIRDICHVHQHHRPSSDTILDAYMMSDADLVWKRETLYALHRWIIHRKRERDQLSYQNARGVLAYASAFRALHVKDTDYAAGIPKYLEHQISDSLEAGAKVAKELHDERRERGSFRVSFLLWFVGTFIALATVVQRYSVGEEAAELRVSPQFLAFERILLAGATYPFHVIAGLLIVVLAYIVPVRIRAARTTPAIVLWLTRFLFAGNVYLVRLSLLLFTAAFGWFSLFFFMLSLR